MNKRIHQEHLFQDYRDQAFTLQTSIFLLLLLMAFYVHNTQFIRKHPGKFAIEIGVIILSSILMVAFLSYFNGYSFLPLMIRVVSLAVILVLCIELGMGSKDAAIWSATLLFAMEFVFFFVYAATTGDIIHRSGELVIPGLLIAFFGAVTVVILTKHSKALARLAATLEVKTPPWVLGMALLTVSLLCMLFVSMIVTSIRVFPGIHARVLVEIVVACLLAIGPFVLVCRDRGFPLHTMHIVYGMLLVALVYLVLRSMNRQININSKPKKKHRLFTIRRKKSIKK